MSQCSLCGAPFSCAMADGPPAPAPCWCTQLPMLTALPSDAAAACWCPACLHKQLALRNAAAPQESAAEAQEGGTPAPAPRD